MSTTKSAETRAGIAYANHDGVSLLGDLYMPANAGRFPTLVAVHGGGWQAGRRRTFQFWGRFLAAPRYVLFAFRHPPPEEGRRNISAGVAAPARTRVALHCRRSRSHG